MTNEAVLQAVAAALAVMAIAVMSRDRRAEFKRLAIASHQVAAQSAASKDAA